MRCLLALLAAAAALIGADAARPTWEQLSASYSYEQFLADFGKSSPATSEYAIRRNLFQERLAAALQHNANPASSWKRGVNHMSDWTEGERKALRGGLRSEAAMRTSMLRHQPRQRPAVGIPSSFDWRSQRGIVTPVKDQGHCGSCWAFASTAVLESHLAIQTGVFAELSPQNLVSCVPNPNQCGGYGGCAGSTADLAFGYVKEHGIASPYSFPYVSWPGDSNGTCAVTPASRATPVANISGYVNLPANEEAPLLEALVAHGPIAVSVAAMPWSDYESGVFDGCGLEGEGTDVDHVVVLVGYDEDSLIIRNSWTPLWGESGYIRLKRTTNCGIDRSPQDGNGCAGGPNDIKVCGMCGVLSDNAYPTGTQLAR